jgi:hypothetical protein
VVAELAVQGEKQAKKGHRGTGPGLAALSYPKRAEVVMRGAGVCRAELRGAGVSCGFNCPSVAPARGCAEVGSRNAFDLD